ncbi:E3 ubiquitin-protein ligase rnf213-alpha-like, partial [Mercenaria mercenaria]|uniref:E3 ubiquitin-protein ligase rnf213-alpha-like n=1 Tax=Mercenaria mercenaria TaxID=6596 RepID=UPI00234F343A
MSNFEQLFANEILATALSVYVFDSNHPLPRPDEILLCTEKTSTDEVDIFWRRALFDNGQKIHCLVNADCLRFDVSEPAEKLLEDYLLESRCLDLKYRLIVICSSENEYRSSLVTFLDKFKRTALPVKMDVIRNYLKDKLVCQANSINGIRPAASLDKERSTVRVVKSWRAGVGKSLFKRRREEELQNLNKAHVVSTSVSIPLHDKAVDTHNVVQRLLEHTNKPEELSARLFHIDVAHEVQQGVDNLLFNLLILGYLSDDAGFVWRKNITDLYLVETLPLMIRSSAKK